MCRMFGMAAEAPTSPQPWLCAAPRSLRALSVEHCDGWGVATRDAGDWRIDRSTSCAAGCERYAEVARDATRLVIAHVRKKTVGRCALANTHPFHRDGVVFAHNGTLPDVAPLAAHTCPEQLARVEGETDSERLFAFLLTQIAAAGEVARGVVTAVRTLHGLGNLGTATFLLSCGTQLYAHRAGRSLFTLARAGATMIASEPLTDEPWQELPDGALVMLDRTSVRALAA